MGTGGLKFKELKVWQKGKDLAVYIYRISNSGDFAKDYGLRDIPKETFKEIEMGCIDMSSMLSKLIAARAKTFSPLPFKYLSYKDEFMHCAVGSKCRI